MKNYVVSGGYMRRIPINAMKNENFPVNSLFFKEFRSETGYRKTASTTTHLPLTFCSPSANIWVLCTNDIKAQNLPSLKAIRGNDTHLSDVDFRSLLLFAL